jgi:methylated-DNA-[protein]-cysteine S-methyltransferase
MMTVAYTLMVTEIGPLFVAETRQGLACVALGDEGLNQIMEFTRKWLPDHQVVPSVVDAVAQIEEYFDGRRTEFDVKLDLRGTDFQKRVWEALRRIPYGQTRTYGELARELGLENGARAVGGACAANPAPVVVPCHRVVAGGGDLGGYSGGLERKKQLLSLEQSRKV